MKPISNNTTLSASKEYSVSLIILCEVLACLYFLFRLIRGRGMWHILKVFNNFLPKYIEIERDNFRMIIKGDDPYWLRLVIKKYEYEPEIRKLIDSQNLDRFQFIDVGANIGYWSLYVLAKYPNAQVVSIEPNPDVYEILKMNMNLNEFHPIMLRVAISKESGTQVPLFMGNEMGGHAGGSLVRDWTTSNKVKTYVVNTLSLDEVIKNPIHDEVFTLVKLDIEGFELEIFKTLRNIGNKYLQIIYEDHGRDRECLPTKYLLDLSLYEIKYLSKDKGGLQIQTINDLIKYKKSRKLGYNLVATPIRVNWKIA